MTEKVIETIGNTPVVRLEKIAPPDCADIYVKLEYFNPTCSYKDRMALSIIEEAERRGALHQGMTVVECTGGSTGTSLAMVCAIKGYTFHVVSSDAFSKEKLQTMKAFGATLEVIHSKTGKITPDLIPRMIDRVREMSASKERYWTRQFENKDALVGYRKLGKEILAQLPGRIDVFCAAVGTAGMVAGVSEVLKDADAQTKVVILEPASAPLLSKGVNGFHHVEGVGVGFVPPLLYLSKYDEAMAVEESDARAMVRRLAVKEGLLVGTSSGLNIHAAIAIGRKLGPGKRVVTVACDSGLKYLASGLFD